MRKSFIIILFSLFIPLMTYGKTNVCHVFLNSIAKNNTATVTENFISYLSMLLGQQILTTQELEAFIKNLQVDNVFNNPLSKDAVTQSNYYIHKQNLQHYCNQAKQLNKDQILSWGEIFLKEYNNVQMSRKTIQTHTESAFVEMKFSPVDLSQWGGDNESNTSHSIEIMRTLVTQKMWMDEMGGINPANFKKGGDYPVENITLWSALAFANKISERHGLKPFYDLDIVKWMGEAKKGTLRLVNNDDGLLLLKNINTKNENIAQAEGYRLPNLIEWSVFYYHFNSQRQVPIEEVAWMSRNSNNCTHEVNLSPTNTLLGHNDLASPSGNVYVWTNDLSVGATNTLNGLVGGGSWGCDSKEFYSFPVLRRNINKGDSKIGLRLVRTLSKIKRPQ